jgi:hypothetical protein
VKKYFSSTAGKIERGSDLDFHPSRRHLLRLLLAASAAAAGGNLTPCGRRCFKARKIRVWSTRNDFMVALEMPS